MPSRTSTELLTSSLASTRDLGSRPAILNRLATVVPSPLSVMVTTPTRLCSSSATCARPLQCAVHLNDSYLGRPGSPHARVVFQDSELSAVVNPKGWDRTHKDDEEAYEDVSSFNNRKLGAGITPCTGTPNQKWVVQNSWVRTLSPCGLLTLISCTVAGGLSTTTTAKATLFAVIGRASGGLYKAG